VTFCDRKRIEKENREMLGKFTAKTLYEWNDRKFDWEYLKKLERN